MTFKKTFSKRIVIAFAVISFVLTSCHVMFIGAYDAVTDSGIQKIQTDVTTLIIAMEKNVTDGNFSANNYDSLKNTFTIIEGEIKSLQIRAAALPKYSIILGQLTTVANTVSNLESLSKTPIKNIGILQTVQSTFDIQFQQMATLQNALKLQNINTKQNNSATPSN